MDEYSRQRQDCQAQAAGVAMQAMGHLDPPQA
jgi:hypothetical protein